MPDSACREMPAKRVLVEIALSSNDLILGVKGASHPLGTYLKLGAPLALVTDDAGVSKSMLTPQGRKAVEERGLDHRTRQRTVRNSLEYCLVEPT